MQVLCRSLHYSKAKQTWRVIGLCPSRCAMFGTQLNLGAWFSEFLSAHSSSWRPMGTVNTQYLWKLGISCTAFPLQLFYTRGITMVSPNFTLCSPFSMIWLSPAFPACISPPKSNPIGHILSCSSPCRAVQQVVSRGGKATMLCTTTDWC